MALLRSFERDANRFAFGIMLAIGALWGSSLLFHLKEVEEYTHLNLFEINAHGQGQIYGWLGLAFLGASARLLPGRFRFGQPVLFLMLAGVLLNILGLYLIPSPLTALLGGSCLAGAAALFAVDAFPKMSEQEKGSPPFLQTALLFFLLSTLYSLWHHHRILTLESEKEILKQVASFQAPLRDLQVHGMGLFFAIGLAASHKSWKSWWLLLFGVIGESSLFLLYRVTENTLFAPLLLLPWLALFIGALQIQFPFRRPTLWLKASLAMLLFLPFYSFLSKLPFSHAYYGAIRHAITVGCLSQIVLRLIAVANRPAPAFFHFLLLFNFGCFLRVALQILTDFHPIAFALIPISGIVEFLALAGAAKALLSSRARQKEAI